MDNTADKLIQMVKADTYLSAEFKAALAEQPAPVVELGEWNGIGLSYCKPDFVRATLPDGVSFSSWKPGQCADGGLNKSPRMTNALLEAYRRAAKMEADKPGTCPGAVIPPGWEWLRDEIPESPCEACNRAWNDHVWLGRISDDYNAVWPVVDSLIKEAIYPESRRRATQLGICEPAPTEKSAEERLREAGAKEIYRCADVPSDVGRVRAYVVNNGEYVTLFIGGLPLPRAEAALRASRGDFDLVALLHTRLDLASTYAEELTAQLAAANAEIGRLKGELGKAMSEVGNAMEERDKLRGWKEQSARLSRRNHEIEKSLCDRDETIRGLRRIQDMLARNRGA